MSEINIELPSIEDRRLSVKKSAFNSTIYQDSPLEFYIPLIDNTYSYFYLKLRKIPDKLPAPKFYQAHDTLLAHYKDYDMVIRSMRKPESSWHRLMERYVKSPNFLQINSVTSNSPELAALAGSEFLVNVYRYMLNRAEKKTKLSQKEVDKLAQLLPELLDKDGKEFEETLRENKCCGGKESEVASLLSSKAELYSAVRESSIAVKYMIEEIDRSMSEAQGLIKDLSGFSSFNHEALSLTSFLQNPDEFRKRVRLLRYTLVYNRRFLQLLPTSLSHRQIVSQVGIIGGIEKMSRETQIKDILPSELALFGSSQSPHVRSILTARIVQKQVLVYSRAATLKPIIFIDKSGSMGESFENIPKISIAAGLALALHSRFDSDIYLFDTEVMGPVNRGDIIDTLLRIDADGGTRIAGVLETIARIGKRDYVYIIISDGIDDVSDSELRVVSRLRSNIRFILVPPAWETRWLREFKYVYARDVASFERSVISSLS